MDCENIVLVESLQASALKFRKAIFKIYFQIVINFFSILHRASWGNELWTYGLFESLSVAEMWYFGKL